MLIVAWGNTYTQNVIRLLCILNYYVYMFQCMHSYHTGLQFMSKVRFEWGPGTMLNVSIDSVCYNSIQYNQHLRMFP